MKSPFRASPSELVSGSSDDKRLVEFVQDEREYDREAFNRVSYAMQLLRLLKVRHRVAICVGTSRLNVEQGDTPGSLKPKPWAILSIPPDASRAHIALTVAQLAGRSADPFLLDWMLRVRPA